MSTLSTTCPSGILPSAMPERAHQFITQLKAKGVKRVPPSMFLFERAMSPAIIWQPPPKSRQNQAAVRRAAGVIEMPRATGSRAAQPMERPRRPRGVGSAKG